MNGEIVQRWYLQAHSIRTYDGDPAREGNPPTTYWQGEVSANRFADRALREVLAVLEGYVDQRIPASEYLPRLKQHFGVE